MSGKKIATAKRAKAKMPTKEQIYDEQIYPLMGQIIEICQQHKIALVAQFRIGNDESGEPLLCTSVLATDEFEPTEMMKQTARILVPQPPMAFAFTVSRGK